MRTYKHYSILAESIYSITKVFYMKKTICIFTFLILATGAYPSSNPNKKRKLKEETTSILPKLEYLDANTKDLSSLLIAEIAKQCEYLNNEVSRGNLEERVKSGKIIRCCIAKINELCSIDIEFIESEVQKHYSDTSFVRFVIKTTPSDPQSSFNADKVIEELKNNCRQLEEWKSNGKLNKDKEKAKEHIADCLKGLFTLQKNEYYSLAKKIGIEDRKTLLRIISLHKDSFSQFDFRNNTGLKDKESN